MRNKNFLILLLCSVFLFIVIILMFHHFRLPRVTNIDNNYKITISASKRNFLIGEPIIINYKIKNIDDVPKTLCFKKFDPEPSWKLGKQAADPTFVEGIKRRLSGKVDWQFRIDVRKDRDAYTLEPVMSLCLEFSGTLPAQKQDFITLHPNESYSCTLNLLDYIYRINMFAKEGTYKIRIWYDNVFYGTYFGVNAEKGNITSDWISIKVI